MIINPYAYANTLTATKLIFYTQPDGGVTGVDLTQQPVVRAVNNSNVLDTSFTGNVTIAVYSGSGTLSGTTTVAAVGGVATFTNLRITQLVGGHAVLKASASGLTDGRTGQMTVMPAPAVAGAAINFDGSGQRFNFTNGVSNVDAKTIVVLCKVGTSTAGARLLGRNAQDGGNRWVFAYSLGTLLYLQTRATTPVFALSSESALTTGVWYCLAASQDGSTGAPKLYRGLIGSAMTADALSTADAGSGAFTDPSAADVLCGADSTSGNGLNGDVGGVALFNTELTLAQIQEVRDMLLDQTRDFTARPVNDAVSGCIGFWQLGRDGASSVTDRSGAGNNGTAVGSPTLATGETVWFPSAMANSLDAIDEDNYWWFSSHAEIAFTTTATSVCLGMYRNLNNYADQNCINVFEGTTYKGRISAATNGAYNVGTLALTAGSKTVRLVHSVRSRNGDPGVGEGFEGTHAVSVWFNAAATQLVPSTPSTHYLFVTDSITDGFVADNEGVYGPINQLRNYLYAGGARVSTIGYGGHTLYKAANDATARTATVTAVKAFNPSHLIIELGLNDYNNNLWSPSSFETALGTLLSDLNTEFPSLLIYLVTCPTLATGEGANAGGNTVAQFRTAQSNAASGKSYVTVRTGTTGWFNGTNLGDSIHPNNDGGDEIYVNAKAMLGV